METTTIMESGLPSNRDVDTSQAATASAQHREADDCSRPSSGRSSIGAGDDCSRRKPSRPLCIRCRERHRGACHVDEDGTDLRQLHRHGEEMLRQAELQLAAHRKWAAEYRAREASRGA